MTNIGRLRRAVGTVLVLALGGLLATPAPAAAGARIVVVPGDGPNEGFNDPTPAAPVGGNPGTTRGAQRLHAFQFAANRWGETLDSSVTIFVLARFDPLGANILGQAGTGFVASNFGGDSRPGFPGPQFANTWYHAALAEMRGGVDLLPGEPDIIAQFSSDTTFYLGLDNNHGALPDLVAVVLHELAHGLGFSNFMSEATGANFQGQTDVFSHFTLDTTTGALFSDLVTDAQRAAASRRVDKIVWAGDSVNTAVPSVLVFGRPELNITAPAALSDTFRVGTASFGPALGSPALANNVVLANDGVGATADACTPLTPANAALVSGRIALVDRGTCTFVVKVAVAQAAGAVAVIVANNAAADPPPGLGGVDPTITIPSIMISQSLGTAIKAQLAGGQTVSVTLGLDTAQRAGTDGLDRAQLFATNPVQQGSSISHFDSIAFRNQLMEPAINPDLTHELIPPFDLTLPQMRDVGWFIDANLDGKPDQTFGFGRCVSNEPNALLANGATLVDQARVWYRACRQGASTHGDFVSCVARTTNGARRNGLLADSQKGAVQSCAAQASLP